MTMSLDQLTALNEEIAALVRGGMPLELGLRELGKDSAGSLQQITQVLANRLARGESLAEAVGAEKEHLPASYRTLITAGIRAGRLPAALEAVSNYARELNQLRKQVALALLYPLLVLLLAYVLFVAFVSHAIVRFRETYEVFRFRVPMILNGAANMAEWTTTYWWVVPGVLLLLLAWWGISGGAQILAFRGLTQPLGWFPLVQSICRDYRTANFAELLALMIEHQVPLPEGLRLAADATADPQLMRAGSRLADAIEQSAPQSSAAGRTYGLPPFLYWALTCRQSGDELVRLLRHSSAMARRKALRASRRFQTLFPIAAAVVIGGGAVALYSLTLFGPLAEFWHDLGVN
jgi:general secretion pathway protein F